MEFWYIIFKLYWPLCESNKQWLECVIKASSWQAEMSYRFKFLSEECDVIKWKHFPRYWPFVQGIHRSPVNSPYRGQCRGALMFSLICAWINGWVNNRDAGNLRRHRANYDVTLMIPSIWILVTMNNIFQNVLPLYIYFVIPNIIVNSGSEDIGNMLTISAGKITCSIQTWSTNTSY